jgi:hypothetical protein
MLTSFRFSTFPIPPTIVENGETLNLFTPNLHPVSILEIDEADFKKMKQPYDVYYKSDVVHIKGQRIKTKLIGLTGNHNVLTNRSYERIGTWNINPLSYKLD